MNFKLVGIQGSNLLDGDKTFTLGWLSKFGVLLIKLQIIIPLCTVWFSKLKTYLDFYA
jgi:hypothetical protein